VGLPFMIAKIEATAGFLIIDRSGSPLSLTDAGRDFIREAHQILQAAGNRRLRSCRRPQVA
jgi:DNA-binding transcriptional LysR family regulator